MLDMKLFPFCVKKPPISLSQWYVCLLAYRAGREICSRVVTRNTRGGACYCQMWSEAVHLWSDPCTAQRSSTHRERLRTLLDNEAFDQMGEDVGFDYGLGWFALSIVLAAVSVSIPRGHDWSNGRPSPVNTSSMANSTNADHLDLVTNSCCSDTQSMQSLEHGSLMLPNVLAKVESVPIIFLKQNSLTNHFRIWHKYNPLKQRF